ncbi:hypothetical protein [uncultured Limosilactobacillus sp.]|uniref:hypothetical protein n=1 Tax=uncultured Limosilactobacillus sp. TaxID=2837629 RepID=UPI0025F047A3|nr:hypothetical protein [uncultured Limosilactobacillus sp.]
MPKQGRFAAAKRVKQLNNFRQKHQHHESRVIDNDQLVDFLLVRFALTTKKRLPADGRESLQRFLQEMVPRLATNGGNVGQTIEDLLPLLRTRVPWQFFWQVSDQWALFQHFLQREVPAVPLEERLLIVNPLTPREFNVRLAASLAGQLVSLTTLRTKLPAKMKQAMVIKMRAAIFDGTTFDWEKVRTLWRPFPFDIDSAPDEKTRQWLLALLAE